MSPAQLVKVVRPATKYNETAEGATERQGEARELQLFIRNTGKEERVFIHPSSFCFSSGNYSCPWLVFNSLVRTSRPFLRDVTESTAYALLLFGGPMSVQASKDTISIDDWCILSANARIGSLLGGMRKRVDELLERKVVEPSFDISGTPELKLISKLLKTDGLGT